MSPAATPRRGKICMVTYVESPAMLPPMLHEGLSLARAGFEVEALCLASAETRGPVEHHAPGFTTRRLPVWTRRAFHALLGRGRARGAVAAAQWGLTYAEYVARALVHALASGADSYEAHDLPPLLPAVLAAKLRRRPVLYRAHELWSETHARVRFAGFWRLLDRTLVPHCDEVVTPDEQRSAIYRDEFRARRTPLTVRNCPPWRPPLESTALRDELRRRGLSASTVVLYQGLVDSMRCIEELAEATRAFDDGVVLAVVGSGTGPWADPAAALARHPRVVVLGRVPYAELPALTASADVGVLLYRNDCRNNYLCAPNKVFEYMMMGLPVVGPSFPGIRALVEGGDVGLCVDPEDPAEIAAAVNALARDAAARARMRANGLRLSRERYNWELEVRPLLARHGALAGAARGAERAAG
jgi:glycosyltransferase involved in cell wall biosynthesis